MINALISSEKASFDRQPDDWHDVQKKELHAKK